MFADESSVRVGVSCASIISNINRARYPQSLVRALAGEDVAKIYVRDDQLEAAFGEDGFYPRGVAMNSGLAIEVVLAKE